MLGKLKLEKPFFSVFSIIYLVIGVALLILLIQSEFTLFHVGLLGALNLIAFYGMIQKERRAIYLAIGLSSIGIVFGYTVIYAASQMPNSSLPGTIRILAMALHVLFSVVSFFYLVLRRDKFS